MPDNVNAQNTGMVKRGGFTLLELLIVLIIVSVFLAVTYPRMRNLMLYSGTNSGIIKTKNALNRLLRERYTALSNKAVYVKFNFKKNTLEVFYKKTYKLLPLKSFRDYMIKYKGILLYRIDLLQTKRKSGHFLSRGNSKTTAAVYVEISPNAPLYPFYIYFKGAKSGKITRLFVNTLENNIKLD